MKIVSWNVNSVRARITNILDYIKKSTPDILLLQEIKAQDENFPFKDFKNEGYDSHIFGQKSYNGVAILSKVKVGNIKKNLIKDEYNQSRIISGEILYEANSVICKKPLATKVPVNKAAGNFNLLKIKISIIEKEINIIKSKKFCFSIISETTEVSTSCKV